MNSVIDPALGGSAPLGKLNATDLTSSATKIVEQTTGIHFGFNQEQLNPGVSAFAKWL